MGILDTVPGLLDALRGEMTPKFLATRNSAGMPNVVPVVSILPSDDEPDTLFFGNFLLRKSIQNLQEDPRVCVLVITPQLEGWVLLADFVEFQRTGPYVERQMNSSLLRYNAYTGVRNAGILRVKSALGGFKIGRLNVALDYIRAKVAAMGAGDGQAGGIVVPRPVCAEFAKMVAVKVLAWVGPDGYPRIAPVLSLQPAGRGVMIHWLGSQPLGWPSDGDSVACNILTFEAVSYQLKGQWAKRGKTGAVTVREVYAGGPPLPGGRIA
ncbi:MAG: hypothetical protein Kow00123_06490 [Anaerolineales bacterium]